MTSRDPLAADVPDPLVVHGPEQDRIRLVLDAAACGMVLVDVDGEILFANDQAALMFGCESEEMTGRSVESLIPDRHRSDHVAARRSYAADPSARSMGADRALRALRSDGTEFPVEVGLTPIDEGTAVMVTLLDISERIAAEEEIGRQTAHLERLNEELAQLAYGASHDLRSPLVAIDGILSCLLDDLEAGDISRARDDIDQVRDLVQRQAGLVEGILGFARSESRGTEIEPVDVARLLAGIEVDLAAELDAADVELHCECSPELTIHTDRHRLQQILTNLIANGAKFSNRDLDHRSVGVTVQTRSRAVVISVVDNGIGIPAEVHDDVFTMFRRFHPDITGTGLGLAMVKRHVDYLRGSITFTSSPAGTTFTVAVPSQSPSDADALDLPSSAEPAKAG